MQKNTDPRWSPRASSTTPQAQRQIATAPGASAVWCEQVRGSGLGKSREPTPRELDPFLGPRLASPHLAVPRLASPHLASPRLASPRCVLTLVLVRGRALATALLSGGREGGRRQQRAIATRYSASALVGASPTATVRSPCAAGITRHHASELRLAAAGLRLDLMPPAPPPLSLRGVLPSSAMNTPPFPSLSLS